MGGVSDLGRDWAGPDPIPAARPGLPAPAPPASCPRPSAAAGVWLVARAGRPGAARGYAPVAWCMY
ncbi:hypothetical protein GCM10011578_033700 [Streptomyces fuscichromogenes]|uniref:Uncharacterized protein n=1 Tax=Streptomyces fuscichromogenes TaxID=1324013 RepID=A0A917XCJ9_9ACTN|nr:hypothetical protein GCM10011578_033700 [Streptomyces fuscichromogenes]